MSWSSKAVHRSPSSVVQHVAWWGGSALAALLMLALVNPPAHAQTADDALRFSERLPGSGARMTGMAGAGVSGVADFGALYTNPAGLGYLRQSQVVGAFSVLGVQDDASYALAVEEPDFFNSQQTVTDYGVGNVGLAYKIPTQRGSLVLAGGVNRTATFERTLDYVGENDINSITDTYLPFGDEYTVSGDEVTFDFESLRRAYLAGAIEFVPELNEQGEYPFIQAVTPGTLIQQSDEVIEEGQLTEANFGGAVEAAEGVMAGASLNISFGTYRFSRSYQELDINNENTPDLYEVAFNNGFLRGFDELNVRETITSDLAGVSFRAGLTADINSALRAGVVIESPTWYSVNETFGTRVTTFFDEGFQGTTSLSDGQTGSSEFEYSVRSPWRLGGGAALELGSLRVLADLEFVDWTQLRLSADGTSFDEANDRIRDFTPVVNSRVGAEYRFDALTVRGGYAYQPDPREVEIELPDGETTDRSKSYYSAGFSYQFDAQFRVDFGWSQQRFNDQYRPYASNLIPEGGGAAPFVDEEITRNRFVLGIAYSF